jgi:hypothetical protein
LEQTTLSLEKEKILAYIAKYGDTRVSDLVNYGKLKLKLPEEQIKSLLSNMVLYGELARVVHEELEPPMDYLRWGAVPHAEGLQAYSLFLNGRRLDDNEINHIKAILEDSEKIAEKRIKKKFPEITTRIKHKKQRFVRRRKEHQQKTK